jgi:predicted RNase H-like HicB family nuclease
MKTKGYYAVFEQTSEAIEVHFPDLKGCVTFGDNMEEAFEMAMDVLAGWLQESEPQFIKEPSTFKTVRSHYKGENIFIMRIPVNDRIKRKYEEKKRLNISIPASIIKKIDLAAKERGVNRSEFIADAAMKVIE